MSGDSSSKGETGTSDATATSGDSTSDDSAGSSGATSPTSTSGAGSTGSTGSAEGTGTSDTAGTTDPTSTTASPETTDGAGTDTTGTEQSGPLMVVVLGSSTAAGKNLDVSKYGGDDVDGLNDRYSVLFADYLDVRWPGSVVDNVAEAGASTFEGLPTNSMTVVPMGLQGPDPSKNVSYAIAQGAHAIIINYPAPRVATPQWVANHREIVDAAEGAGVAAWVALPQPAYDIADVATVQGNRDALLAEFGQGQTIDFHTPLLGGNNAMDPAYALTDNSHHPNAAANVLFFEAILDEDIPGQLGWME